MKTLKLLFFVSAISFAIPALAGVAWAKTKFWQVPYETGLTLKIKAADAKLPQLCKEYTELVKDADKSDLSSEEISYMRSQPARAFEKDFWTSFVLNSEASQVLLAQSIDKVNSESTQNPQEEIAFGYTQKNAELVPQLTSYTNLAIVDRADSLLSISRSVGLKPLGISIVGSGSQLIIKVSGKDSACDLLSGKANLNLNASAIVKISLEEQTRIDSFYKKIESVSKEVFAKSNSTKLRSALFGFKMADVLTLEKVGYEAGAQYIHYLVENFFDSDMNRNEVWRTFNNEWHLSVDGNTSVGINYKLEI